MSQLLGAITPGEKAQGRKGSMRFYLASGFMSLWFEMRSLVEQE